MAFDSVVNSAQMAGNILEAIQAGSVATLQSELDRTHRLLRRLPPALGVLPAEQADLLAAIAHQLDASLHRLRRHPDLPMEASQVHLRLLRHLAQSPPVSPRTLTTSVDPAVPR